MVYEALWGILGGIVAIFVVRIIMWLMLPPSTY